MEDRIVTPIAEIRTDFPEKFGIPRQSNLISGLTAEIRFFQPYASMDAVKGLDGYDYIWLLWFFQGTRRDTFHATVRPPRLGGNETVGVFASRSPFRPNGIGLSCVRLLEIRSEEGAPVLIVEGADLRDHTPIVDIKPYLPHMEAHPDARGGFAVEAAHHRLLVILPDEIADQIPQEKRDVLIQILEQDPRPSYQDDPDRIYGLSFGNWNVRFTVAQDVLTVCEVVTID